MKQKINLGSFILVIWLAGSFIGAMPVLRSVYKNQAEWPNGDEMGVFSIGVGEIFAPIWFPVWGIGKIITINL